MSYANRGITPKTLTEDEQHRLLVVTGQHAQGFRDHVIFALAISTGLRAHEILALDYGDVFTPAGNARRHVTLRVFKTCSDDPGAQRITLSDKMREKLDKLRNREARDHGEARVAPENPIFVSREGNRLSERMLRHAFAEWQRRAGFDRIHNFHALRHTACTNLYKATKDLRLTQRFARHASVTSTQIYTHSSDDDLVRAVNGLTC